MIKNPRFKYVPHELSYKELKSRYTSKGRVYTTPDGDDLLSVTTVMSILSEDAIKQWRARVGTEEANKKTRRASNRGSEVHALVENYLINNEDDVSSASVRAQNNFNQIRSILDEHLTEINGIELPLYSSHLGLAGRTDLVGVFMGKRSIIDFKTSEKEKKKEWCHGYFQQETAYSIMYEEQTSISVPQLVTIIANDVGRPQVFVQSRNRWAVPLQETIERYVTEKL